MTSDFSVAWQFFSKRTIVFCFVFFITDQTLCPYPTRSLPAQFHFCIFIICSFSTLCRSTFWTSTESKAPPSVVLSLHNAMHRFAGESSRFFAPPVSDVYHVSKARGRREAETASTGLENLWRATATPQVRLPSSRTRVTS
jgi:hypothetical protein